MLLSCFAWHVHVYVHTCEHISSRSLMYLLYFRTALDTTVSNTCKYLICSQSIFNSEYTLCYKNFNIFSFFNVLGPFQVVYQCIRVSSVYNLKGLSSFSWMMWSNTSKFWSTRCMYVLVTFLHEPIPADSTVVWTDTLFSLEL